MNTIQNNDTFDLRNVKFFAIHKSELGPTYECSVKKTGRGHSIIMKCETDGGIERVPFRRFREEFRPFSVTRCAVAHLNLMMGVQP